MNKAENVKLLSIIDQTKINTAMEDDVSLEISDESAITNKTNAKAFLDQFNETSGEESSSSDAAPTPRSISAVSVRSVEVSVVSDHEISDIFSESDGEVFFQKEILNDGTIKSQNHQEILIDIEDTEVDLKEIRIKVPHYDVKKVNSDPEYAAEIRAVLLNEYENNVMASSLREMIVHVSSIVEVVMDGQYNHKFKFQMPQMKGYSNQVRMNISQLKRETLMVSKSFRGKLGDSPVVALKLIRFLVVPFVTTFLKNNGPGKKTTRVSEYQELESDDEDSD